MTLKSKQSKNSHGTRKEVKSNIWDVVVIGGGPAGLMAASEAAKMGAKVTLLEKNDVMGKKLLLTGGGRCNLTNAEPDLHSFVSKFGKKGSFLFTPLSVFGTDDTVRFFEKLGVKTKVEAGYRVFPESDNALDILGALTKNATQSGVEIELNTEVSHFKKSKEEIVSVILSDGREIKGKNFILATGGLSHPETGSTGDGFKWLKEIGHKVISPNPSLVPIKLKESWVSDLAGITLEDVGVSVWIADKVNFQNKKVLSKKGRILFTHDGLSGPTIINMSKSIGDLLEKNEVKVSIDFFPGIGLDVMHKNMVELFEANPKKKIKNLTFKEVPEKIYLKILELIGMDGEWFVNEVKKAERMSIVEMFKKFELMVDSLLGYDKAIVSSGGVDLSEVDFKTMQSKIYDNLYLVGDILDFDRNSGGYSLQLCWTTGYIAGKSVAKNL
jgi:predicted Rossmann fold flavoprotein